VNSRAKSWPRAYIPGSHRETGWFARKERPAEGGLVETDRRIKCIRTAAEKEINGFRATSGWSKGPPRKEAMKEPRRARLRSPGTKQAARHGREGSAKQGETLEGLTVTGGWGGNKKCQFRPYKALCTSSKPTPFKTPPGHRGRTARFRASPVGIPRTHLRPEEKFRAEAPTLETRARESLPETINKRRRKRKQDEEKDSEVRRERENIR